MSIATNLLVIFHLLVLVNYGFADSNNTRSIITTLSSDPRDIHFLVYTPQNPNISKTFKIGSSTSLKRVNLNPGKVILYVSGFSSKNQAAPLLVNAYLSRGASNVIVVDWSKLSGSWLPFLFSFPSYLEALRNVEKVGIKGSKLIQYLVANGILTEPADVHCVGHSLGAHVCGSIGRHTWLKSGKKLGRVTGLDAAGPFHKLQKQKLTKLDATFVDVIHSDVDGLGSPETFGHADFYINGGLGKNQPGCRGLDPIARTACAHVMALYFFVNTIKGDVFNACACKTVFSVDGKILHTCRQESTCKNSTIVGEDCSAKTSGKFYVDVKVKVAPTLIATLFDAVNLTENKRILDTILSIMGQLGKKKPKRKRNTSRA